MAAPRKNKAEEEGTTVEYDETVQNAEVLPSDQDFADRLDSAAESDGHGEKGCQRGGDANWHPATWETTERATGTMRYCDAHRPANHDDLTKRQL